MSHLKYIPVDFLLYPIMSSLIFFLSQLTTFIRHMTQGLISLSTHAALAILLIIYLSLLSLHSFLLQLKQELLVPFSDIIVLSNSTDLHLLFLRSVERSVHVVAFCIVVAFLHALRQFLFFSFNNYSCCSYQSFITLSLS